MHLQSIPPAILRSLRFLIILLLPPVLMLGPVFLLTTDQYLAFEYGKSGFPPDPFGFDAAQRLAYASANFRYVREGQPLAALADQRLGNNALYNARELKHMQDVQNVYEAVGWAWQLALGGVALAIAALAWRAETRPGLAAALKWGGLFTVALVGGLGFLAIIAWQFWFVAFHQIFFTPGTWSFNYSDTLIRLFPEKFWFDAALTISGLSVLGGLIVSCISYFVSRTTYQTHATQYAIRNTGKAYDPKR